MMGWSSSTRRATMMLVAALCTGTMMPVVAQQPTANAAQTSAPNTALAGPRLQAEWPRFEPRIGADNTTTAAAVAANSSHTIVFSTLALVIIGVIVLVLVL